MQMSVADYNKLLKDHITAKNRKTNKVTVSAINSEVKTIASKLQLESRIERTSVDIGSDYYVKIEKN